MKQQSDNIHDHNAVVILTDDGKELGFMPKCICKKSWTLCLNVQIGAAVIRYVYHQ